MRVDSSEFDRYQEFTDNNKINENFSEVATKFIFNNCDELARECDDHFCRMNCKGEKCKYYFDMPIWIMPDSDFYEQNYIEEYKDSTSQLDECNQRHSIEDVIITNNCNIIILKQSVYRKITEKYGYAIRLLISPSIYEEDIEIGSDLLDIYNEDKIWNVKVWSPTNDDLFAIIQQDSRYLEMLKKLVNNIDLDPQLLVEEYMEDKDKSWIIDELNDGDYYYTIDCRALISALKQIMICEDELYPREKGCLGREKIIKEFYKFNNEVMSC